jgi:hypothetical protein
MRWPSGGSFQRFEWEGSRSRHRHTSTSLQEQLDRSYCGLNTTCGREDLRQHIARWPTKDLQKSQLKDCASKADSRSQGVINPRLWHAARMAELVTIPLINVGKNVNPS